MIENLFWILFSFSILYLPVQPNIIPDHILYFHYTFTFNSKEKDIIQYHALKAKNDFSNYKWPENTFSPKLNNFFRILNDKKYDKLYTQAVLYILSVVPELVDEAEMGC